VIQKELGAGSVFIYRGKVHLSRKARGAIGF